MSDVSAFREGMSRLGAAVNLIATDGAEGRHGIIASAVCPVTDAPPMLLACINTAAHAHDRLLSNGVLCVNVLGAEHQALSEVFARYRPGVDRFAHGDWTTMSTGAPVLADANAAFDCRIVSRKLQGTHSVLFCEVEAVRLPGTPGEGLVWFGRGYRRLARPA
ncbi:flavin reductase family protein [Poseidonocella sp. HB161398]|uniref:flavin reductase family protein n=1 Tax=Poseidonocella sp. HB161398 TaxID=2320855 RepID=UPI00197DF10F|nr:flavin reductase family protein [Poseidonocella sp. HB161398]